MTYVTFCCTGACQLCVYYMNMNFNVNLGYIASKAPGSIFCCLIYFLYQNYLI